MNFLLNLEKFRRIWALTHPSNSNSWPFWNLVDPVNFTFLRIAPIYHRWPFCSLMVTWCFLRVSWNFAAHPGNKAVMESVKTLIQQSHLEMWGEKTEFYNVKTFDDFNVVEIGISLRFDKKYFGWSHFRFVIFSLV